MGTEVQTKMHLPGYHTTRDLNDNASGGDWPLYHQSKALKNGQFHNLFSAKPSSDAFLGHDKETLRQTILKHESVFRHQLHELHRLYKKQMDLMNGIKTSKLHNPCHAFGLPMASSHFDIKGKIKQSGRDYSMNAETMKDCELLESKCKKPKKVLIDLELPADEYIGSEEEQLDVSAVSRVESHSCNQSLRSNCHGDYSKSKPYLRRTNGLTNLNEPFQFGKASTSASVDIPIQTNATACSKEDTQRWNLSANLHSAFQHLGKELPNFNSGRDGVISGLCLQNDKNKNECVPYSPEHGRASSYRVLQNSVTYKHATVLPTDQRKVEHRNKRTIFGVEICDRNQNASVVASQAEPFFVSTQSRWSSALSQSSPAKGHHCSSASAHLNPKMLTRSKDLAGALLLDSKSIPSSHACRPPSIDFGCRNGTNDSNEPFAKHGQGKYFRGLEFLKDAKSTKYVSADVVSPNRYRNEVPSQQNFAPNDLSRKHENPQGGLCWLRDMMLHKSEASSKEKENCSDLDLLQMGQFATGTAQRKSLSRYLLSQDQRCEVGKNKVVGDCSNNSKILGNSVQLELFEIDNSQSGEQPKAKGHDLNKGLVAHNTDLRYLIDLNICMTEEVEEEAQLTPSSPKIDVNISAEIDLEIAVVGAERALKDHTTEEPQEGHIREAAEALVAISSSQAHDLEDNVICNRSEASSCDYLVWFSEIVALHKGNIDSDEEQDPDEMDYFELMTLGLTETKVEEYSFEPQDQEESKDENVSTKRPRIGQTRRGRQRKDFQRDVLPGLVTLSRYEVKEDLQIIEGLVGASDGTWQASSTRRKAAKGGRGRARRSLGNSATSPKETSACSASRVQQPKTDVPIVEEKSLMSWGKRTRRLRRQRCSNLISHHCVED